MLTWSIHTFVATMHNKMCMSTYITATPKARLSLHCSAINLEWLAQSGKTHIISVYHSAHTWHTTMHNCFSSPEFTDVNFLWGVVPFKKKKMCCKLIPNEIQQNRLPFHNTQQLAHYCACGNAQQCIATIWIFKCSWTKYLNFVFMLDFCNPKHDGIYTERSEWFKFIWRNFKKLRFSFNKPLFIHFLLKIAILQSISVQVSSVVQTCKQQTQKSIILSMFPAYVVDVKAKK